MIFRYFLAQMGVRLRIERLLQQTSNLDDRKKILDSYAMLISGDKNGMGMKFKFFSIFPTTLQYIMNKRGGFPGIDIFYFNFQLILCYFSWILANHRRRLAR